MLLVYPNPLPATETGDLLSTDPLDEDLLENLSLLSEVLAHIQQGHLESPEPKKLMYGAIRGMLRTLDPYSQFFDPESYGDFRTESRGAYGGLGMVIGISPRSSDRNLAIQRHACLRGRGSKRRCY